MLQRYLWKLLPKSQRAFLLGRLSVVDRQVVNKSMSANVSFPVPFEQRSWLFIHVPKCAGSSVCAAMFDDWSPGHLPLYWYEQQFPEQFAASFKFAFVRDPLERAYSAYAFLRGNALGKRDHAAQKLVSHYRDFDDFVGRWLHPNRSQQRRPMLAREFCTVRTRRLVRRVYQRDYEMLGYE